MELGFLQKPVSKNCEKIGDVCANIGIFNTIYTSNIINTGGNPVSAAVETAFPVTGDGSLLTPITFAQPIAPCRTFFWNGSAWNHNIPSGITEVTIGDTANGANFATIQEAFNLGCNFVRVVTSMTEPAVLTLPTNAIIYVDPGVTLTLALGQMNVTNRSLTFMGNASLSSSTIILNGSLLGDANSNIYFYNCRCENATVGPITATSTLHFGNYHAFGTTFVTSNTQYCMFGNATPTTIVLDLVDCIMEGGGGSASEFLTNVTSTLALSINGLTITGTWQLGAVLARTNLPGPWQLNNISVNTIGGSDAANPFFWFMGGGGILQQLKQLAGTNFVHLDVSGDDTQVNNLRIHRLVIDGAFQRMKISNVDCSANISINAAIGLQMTNVSAVGAVFGPPILQDCDINNLRVSGNLVCSSHDTNYSNCHISGTLDGTPTANQRCTFRGVHAALLQCLGIHNSFIGGTYANIDIGLSGESFAFTGVRCSNTMTLNNSRHMIDSCFIENLDLSPSSLCCVSNSVIRNGLICGNGTIISNCKVDTGGGNNNIELFGASNVQISNCTVGTAVSATSTINGIVLPGVGVTLIVNCKTRGVIAASANVINCVTF